MMELLFVLTTVFVAYVVHSNHPEQPAMAAPPKNSAEKPDKPVAAGPVLSSFVPDRPVRTLQKIPLAPVGIRPVVGASGNKPSIRNPKTGEIASLAGNYRFMKRWIKELLVDENLLDKIYKNNELDSESEGKIKQALIRLHALERYRC